MPNVQNIIKQANVRNLQEPQAVSDRQCNCNVPENCPLDGHCCISCIAYEATVKTNNKEYIYFGISDGEWKKRFSFHTMTFRKQEYEGSTELSKFIWSLQDKGESYSIKWRVAEQAHPYKCGTRRCDLCITEKTLIARSRHKGMLNKRSEIISKCRHRNKFALRSI